VSTLDLGLVLLSAFLHAVWSAAIKRSRDPLAFNLVQKGFFAIGLVACLAGFRLAEVPLEVWRIVAITGVAHGLYFYWMSRAFEGGDLSLVYPIVRSTPAFLPFFAVAFFGESVSLPGALGIGIVVAGMWLVHSQGDLRLRALVAPGTGYAYLTLLATVAYSLADKRAMAHLTQAPWSGPVPRSLVYFFLITGANALIFVPLAARRVRFSLLREVARDEWPRAAAAVLVSLAGYTLILEAYRRAPASYVVAVRQVSVLFAVAIGAFWLHERPGRARVIGALATVAGVALIALFP
jgi:drug/metabolite transporter (DMT)-like permease